MSQKKRGRKLLVRLPFLLILLVLTFSSVSFDATKQFFESQARFAALVTDDVPILWGSNKDQEPTLIEISGVHAIGSNNKASNETTVLKQPQAKGKLRHDWSHHEPLSNLSKMIQAHQQNCSLPTVTYHIDNLFGFGSHLAIWSQGMCNAMEMGARLRSYNPIWLWLDQTLCDMEQQAHKSPLLCYFPTIEYQCGSIDEQDPLSHLNNVSDPRDLKRHQCAMLKGKGEKMAVAFRAASSEYIFRRISKPVIREAERQVGLIFKNNSGIAPDDLITVHVRWGDKFWEMKLVVIQEYLDAISSLLHETNGHNRTANIFIATEDPKAVLEFKNATPPGWNIYYDRTVEELNSFRPPKGNRASHTSKNTKGRAGLVGLGSLLVAMEAKYFVLTTKSNWSRLIDNLRKNILDPRCNGCTKMIDLRYGVW
mmetsp:Transcript_22490/g.37206  ORF Transcript_22490/g.37206 Transcript_22490/m.37206 type:complete len:424 (-) Transcript_22490:413-1684(-)|eukprot:CAMPEP_0119023344 /NCGR_PEP_ID=MMETSP1176-20130426/29793_1 /TAXON_ID=265551 /ORGANISM="Synedropsis recta cf, Strain CCMP1620" /LENGTH=423 /DNA_ID=CAMNT_0006978411 /DNA_START=137 /DNA_END=1405 /DNA_ORIENTATION=-